MKKRKSTKGAEGEEPCVEQVVRVRCCSRIQVGGELVG